MLAVLNTYLPRPKNKTGVNLLATTQAEQEKARETDKEEAAKPAEYINFIKPYISISLIDDATAYPANAVPDHVCFNFPSCRHTCFTCSADHVIPGIVGEDAADNCCFSLYPCLHEDQPELSLFSTCT